MPTYAAEPTLVAEPLPRVIATRARPVQQYLATQAVGIAREDGLGQPLPWALCRQAVDELRDCFFANPRSVLTRGTARLSSAHLKAFRSNPGSVIEFVADVFTPWASTPTRATSIRGGRGGSIAMTGRTPSWAWPFVAVSAGGEMEFFETSANGTVVVLRDGHSSPRVSAFAVGADAGWLKSWLSGSAAAVDPSLVLDRLVGPSLGDVIEVPISALARATKLDTSNVKGAALDWAWWPFFGRRWGKQNFSR